MTGTASKGRQRVPVGPPQNGDSADNQSLSEPRIRDAAEVGQAITRMVRAMARRAERGDLQGLAELRKLEAICTLEALRAAHSLHVAHGCSWTEIGLACGISRQAARQRWGV